VSKLREHSKMSLFSLYIDDETKLQALLKLKEIGLDTKKGSLSATIRVLLRGFVDGTIQVLPTTIEQEYLFTTKKNKRSSL